VTGSDRLRERLPLMVITDPLAPLGMLEATEAAIRGGATAVQVRWKDGSARDVLDLCRRLRESTHSRGVLLLVNDRVDIALAAGADGAHLGADDLPLAAARGIVPPGFILGQSVDTAEEARSAERAGASYIGLGPVFPTSSKSDTGGVVGEIGVAEVRASVRIPLVGIGGIDARRAPDVLRSGADGVAVIGAVMHAEDPESATRDLLRVIATAARRAPAR
jgi:thiamine-phosphate pyrophosphorylase